MHILPQHRRKHFKSQLLVPLFTSLSPPKKGKKQPALDPSRLGESNCLGLLCPYPFDDLQKIDEQSTPGSEKIPSLPHHHDGEHLPVIYRLKSVLYFSPKSLCWMMVWKMESEVWYLNINFPDGHASPTGYQSPVLFFWGLIYFRHLHVTALSNFSLEFLLGLQLSCFWLFT